MIFSNVTAPLPYKFFEFIYHSVCLNAFFYRLPHIHTPPPPPPPAYKNALVYSPVGLSVHLSVRLSNFQFVCFSVCIRKQVSITREFHNQHDDETQYTDSHTTARKHSKLSNQFSGSFPQQNDCTTTCIKSLRTTLQN